MLEETPLPVAAGPNIVVAVAEEVAAGPRSDSPPPAFVVNGIVAVKENIFRYRSLSKSQKLYEDADKI